MATLHVRFSTQARRQGQSQLLEPREPETSGIQGHHGTGADHAPGLGCSKCQTGDLVVPRAAQQELRNRLAVAVAYTEFLRRDPRLHSALQTIVAELEDSIVQAASVLTRSRRIPDTIINAGSCESGLEPPVGQTIASKRILVVEDDPLTAEVLRDSLMDEGYTVDLTTDGAEALTRLSDTAADLILLDLTLPVMSGWTFLQARRGRPTLATIPVVVLSGAGPGHEEVSVLRTLGVRAFMGKPFQLDEVLRTVRQLLV